MSKLEEIKKHLEIYEGTNAELHHELIQWLIGVPEQRGVVPKSVERCRMTAPHS
jgi:hypothetical protein